jgi:hypothetical protein
MNNADKLSGMVESNTVVFRDKELMSGKALVTHSGASKSRQPVRRFWY